MKLYLAPMQGMTTAYYRKLYHEMFGGVDAYYAPFVATTGMAKINKKTFRDVDPSVNEDITLLPQMLGNNSSDFRRYAKEFVTMGYDEINWNIGCPYPTVTKKIKGSGLLEHPDRVSAFLDDVCKDDTFDLTVKMRLGLKEPDEGMKIIDLMNDYPIKSVIIHGRVGIQKYEGQVDLDAFEALYKACKHDVIYNGDIYTKEDFERIQSRFPDIEGFMLGRGALRNPYLPSNIKGIEHPQDRLRKIIDLHTLYFNHFKEALSGDKHLLDRMKTYWTYMAFNVDPDGKFIKKLKKCTSLDQYEKLVTSLFQSLMSWD